MISPLRKHLNGLLRRGVLDGLYKAERRSEGLYLRFIRGDVTATDAIRSILDETLAPFWYSIRLYSYDSFADHLEAPIGLKETQTITFSSRAIGISSAEQRRLIQGQRKSELAEHFYEKETSDFGEFFFLIHNEDGATLNKERSFQCLTNSHFRRLYVLDWISAETWYRNKGRTIIQEWYAKRAKNTPIPETFFSVSPLSKKPGQVIFISAFDANSRITGVASLRLFSGALKKADIVEFDRDFVQVVELIAPFIQTYNERIATSRKLMNRAIVLDRFSSILYHDMNNYLPGVLAVAENAASLQRKLTMCRGVSDEQRHVIKDSSRDLKTVADVTFVQTERVKRIRELTRMLRDSSGARAEAGQNGQARSLADILTETIRNYGKQVALKLQDRRLKSIYSNLIGKHIVVARIPREAKLRGEREQFALSVVLEELIKNAIAATGPMALRNNPVIVEYKKSNAREMHGLSVTNGIDENSSISTQMLKSFIKGELSDSTTFEGTGKGLAACDFLLKTVFGSRARLEPKIQSISKAKKRVHVTTWFPSSK